MSRVIVLIFTLLTLTYAKTAIFNSDIKDISRLYSANTALFIDVRDKKEYLSGTVANSLNLPLKKILRFKKILPYSKRAKIVLFSQDKDDNRSLEFAKKLSTLNYTNIYLFKGGYKEWADNKMPQMVQTTNCSSYLKTKEITVDNTKILLANKNGTVDKEWFKSIVKKIPKNIAIIDVRSSKEYLKGHIEGAKSISYNKNNNSIDINKFPKDKIVILYCTSGYKSSKSYELLKQKGKKNIFYLNANVSCKGSSCSIN